MGPLGDEATVDEFKNHFYLLHLSYSFKCFLVHVVLCWNCLIVYDKARPEFC